MPGQLPADVVAFAGRTHHLAEFDSLSATSDPATATSQPELPAETRLAWQCALTILEEFDHPNADEVCARLRLLDHSDLLHKWCN